MNKIFAKSLFLIIPLLFAVTTVLAQTITIGSVDAGPYGKGSTIAVPFHVNDASGCIAQNNIYSLYLCDASGTPIPGAPVDTIKNFYGTAINFTVPAGTPAGTYTFIVKSSSPIVSSSPSSAFTISGTAGGTAAANCPSTQIADPTYPTVYGTCSGADGMQYTFTNASSSGSTVTATFFNEFTQTIEASNVSLNPNYTFTANAANYIVTVKAVSASGIVSTYSYQLINNVVNSNFGSTGNSTACLINGSAQLTYTVDITSVNGIQHNYPGNIYTINWGDGSPNGVYTLCQIEALNGLISHTYTKISCGYNAGATNNAFPVNFFTNNNFCGKIGTVVSDAAEIYNVPQNSFTGPTVACTGTPVSFINTSTPGPCSSNPSALYNWSVDGVVVAYNYSITKNFVPTLTEGNHTISIHHVNPVNGLNCLPSDYSQTICVQDPPKPSFIIAQKIMCISDGPIVPTNTSVIDSSCNKQYSYTWTVKPSAGVTYNSGAFQPSIAFTSPGIYTVSLAITTASCGKVTAPTIDTIVVNKTPVATLSGDFSICGNNQTLSFDSVTTRPTYTILSGTAQPQANTYTWSVTGGTFSYAAGYTLHSKYPHIIFNDYSTYTITVTQQNNCGSTTSTSQHITFQQAPTVNAGNDTTICAGTSAFLKGKITGAGLVSYKWIGGGGTYTPSADSLNTTYTPSATEVGTGHVTLTLQATTAITAPCNLINSSVIITITPTGKITSPLIKSICSNQNLNYQITSNNNPSTYTWTAKLISGSATGFSASGTSSKITDSLINTDPTASTNAVIAYTIIPISSTGCPGTPSTLNVTVTPLPILITNVTNPAICSNQPANITLTSKLSGTTYTWTSTAPANISGNSNQLTAVNTAGINDLLVNNGSSPANVTYVITPFSTNGCQGTPATAVITVEPLPVTANAGPDQTVCGVNTYTLQGNSPGSGHGKWTVVTGSGITFANDTIPNTTANGLVGGNIYQFEWTITTAPGCQSQNTVTLTVNKATVAGVTSSANPTTVCATSNGGLISLTGQTGRVLQWQKSIDNGVTFQTVTPIDSTNSLVYNNLTQTTEYQAIVQNASCDILTSTPITITVNQPAPTSLAGKDTTLCGAASYQLNGNSPGTFAAAWRQISGPPVTFADSTNYQTIVNGLQGGNIYTFTWVIKGASPCSDSQSQVSITDNADVIASFTNSAISSCGSQTVKFTNTSNNQSGASFLWNFGDGVTSTAVNPQHFFKETTNGTDTAYVVSLSILSNCKQRAPVYDTIHITSDKVIAAILPQQTTGCAPFTLDVQNVSPGNNVSYKFYLYNGNALVQEIDKTDKTDAIFTPLNVNAPTQYTVYMTTVGPCGTSATTNNIPINISPPTVTPQMYILNNINSGCAPLSVSFVNNSSGGSSYHYNIYDANGNIIETPIANKDNFPYIFTNPGGYFVSITAANNCSPQGIESAKIPVNVYPVPKPAFAASPDCSSIISFLNTTTQNGSTPAGSLTYTWNFGDGSSDASFTPKAHHYDYRKSPFTVTLTATNTVTGCADSTKQTINLEAPFVAQFTESPDSVTTIPNYQFSFIDGSVGSPTGWHWDFGDGSTSSAKNPEHKYADTGYYQVKLITTGNSSCTGMVTHIVHVTGTPGQLFIPNAFMPTGSSYDLRVFMAKGSGIKTWLLQIFNNYGQLLWQTNQLDSKGSPVNGWDGTFKGILMPQGAYLWQASATFINGSSWQGMSYNGSAQKRTGTVNLIR